jgi:hypothetical protein
MGAAKEVPLAEDEFPQCQFANTRHRAGIFVLKTLSGGQGGETFSFTSDISGCEEFTLVPGKTGEWTFRVPAKK